MPANSHSLLVTPIANIKWLINKQVHSTGKITASICCKIFITSIEAFFFYVRELTELFFNSLINSLIHI